MADLQVTCINKIPRNNPYEGITHLGGPSGPAARPWKDTRETIIQLINGGTHSFYTLVNGKRANIGVVQGPSGPYLRTYADNVYNDNLLALFECV